VGTRRESSGGRYSDSRLDFITDVNALKLKATCAKVASSKSKIYREMSEGKFPRPIRLGPKAVAWLEHELDAYLAARLRERDDGGAR
jgi:prophage regulatory protein